MHYSRWFGILALIAITIISQNVDDCMVAVQALPKFIRNDWEMLYTIFQIQTLMVVYLNPASHSNEKKMSSKRPIKE